MKKQFSDKAKAFNVLSESWYSKITGIPEKSIMVGFYYEGDGTEGEFSFVWDEIGITLRAYNDSWEALANMPELVGLMAEIDKAGETPTIKEFAKRLEKLGYKDITERENN